MGELPKRVALFTPDWPAECVPNGIVTYTEALRGGLRDLGVDVVVISSDVPAAHRAPDVFDSRDSRAEATLGERITDRVLRRFDPSVAAMRRAVPSIARTLSRAYASLPFELFEVEESFGLARASLGSPDYPTLVRLHGPWFLNGRALGVPEDRAFRRRSRIEGETIARAHAVTAPSRDVLEQTRSHFGLELPLARVIPNPADDPPADCVWQAGGCEPGTILFVGRFDLHKGGDLAIDAFARVAAEMPTARLLFVGPDRGLRDAAGRSWSLDSYLADRLPSLEMRSRVEIVGTLGRDAVTALRRRAAVTIVPSRYEVFAMTAVEAIAAGCPLVAARAGGLQELVRDGESGLLFEPGNAGELAAAILALLRDPERAARLAAAGRRDCRDRLSVRTIAEQTAAFYAEVLDRFRDSSGRRA